MNDAYTVGIRCYNEIHEIANCIQSCRKLCPDGTRVIVVDDDSTDGSREVAEELADDVYITGNHLYGENDQTLIENAEAPYLLLLPGDAILMHDPSGLVGPHTDKIIGVVGRAQHGYRTREGYFLCEWYTANQSVWCTNLCCMFNVEAFLEVVSEPRMHEGEPTWYRDIRHHNDLHFWRFARQVDPEYRPLYVKNAVYAAHIDDNMEEDNPGYIGGNYGNPHRPHKKWKEWEPFYPGD